MKIEKGGGEFKKIEVNMTPMIDACFLLIIFFILTLKLFSPGTTPHPRIASGKGPPCRPPRR